MADGGPATAVSIGEMLSARIPVLFADESIVVVDKPAGLPTVPAPDTPPDACVRVAGRASARGGPVGRAPAGSRHVGRAAASRAPPRRTAACAWRSRSGASARPMSPSPRACRHSARGGSPRRSIRPGAARCGPRCPGEAGAWDTVTRYVVRKRWARAGEAVAMVEAHPETGRHHQNPGPSAVDRHARALRPVLRNLARRAARGRPAVDGWRCTRPGWSVPEPGRRGAAAELRGPARRQTSRRCCTGSKWNWTVAADPTSSPG